MLSLEESANDLVTYMSTRGALYSLHTGNPGATGNANELSGGGYARKTTGWGTAAGGIIIGSQMEFDVPDSIVRYMVRRKPDGTPLDIMDTVDATISPAGKLKVTPRLTAPFALPS